MQPFNHKNVNRLLWAAQILLALVFLSSGAMKFVLPADKMQGPINLPLAFIRFIGICEILGALGLILPGLLHIRAMLTPLAGSGLVLIMIGATVLTAIGMGVAPALFPLIVGIVAGLIAYGRWRVAPLADGRNRVPHAV